ncbi:MAG: hypothetical protein KAJ14_06135, partial [Candidatus Omnitrophica bacterium]|nr:hypothetical protein [Candidatus Omnitrophota bacterium]
AINIKLFEVKANFGADSNQEVKFDRTLDGVPVVNFIKDVNTGAEYIITELVISKDKKEHLVHQLTRDEFGAGTTNLITGDVELKFSLHKPIETETGTFNIVTTLKMNDGKLDSQETNYYLNGKQLIADDRFNITSKVDGQNITRQYVVEDKNGILTPIHRDTRLAGEWEGEVLNINGSNYEIVSDWNKDSHVSFLYDVNGNLMGIEGDVIRRDEKGIEHTGVLLHKDAIGNQPVQEFLVINGNSILRDNDTGNLVINNAQVLTQTQFYTYQQAGQIVAGAEGKGKTSSSVNIIKAFTDSNGNIVIKENQLITIQKDQWVLTNGDVLTNVSEDSSLLVRSSDGNTIFQIISGAKGTVSNGGIEITEGIAAINANTKIVKLDSSGDISGTVIAGDD